jgi:hypothetical protein
MLAHVTGCSNTCMFKYMPKCKQSQPSQPSTIMLAHVTRSVAHWQWIALQSNRDRVNLPMPTCERVGAYAPASLMHLERNG